VRQRTDRVIEVAGGTRLGIAEFGDLTGRPIFAFHGSPSCRLNLTFVDDAARRHGVRVIAPDRWGIGLSPMADRQRLVTWADDVGALADAMGIEGFGVLGLSGGGPYALACAARLPDRIDAVAVVSSPGPMGVPELRAVMSRTNRLWSTLSVRAPIVLEALFWGIGAYARRWPEAFTRMVMARLPAPDRDALWRSGAYRAAYAPMTAEAIRTGSRGCVLDYRLQSLPWGFDPVEITGPMHLWHGDADRFVSPPHAEWLAVRIPNAIMQWCPGEGHLLILDHIEQILESATRRMPG
jgi:pimeloyl-ACP methyl ester carboxylesterase